MQVTSSSGQSQVKKTANLGAMIRRGARSFSLALVLAVVAMLQGCNECSEKGCKYDKENPKQQEAQDSFFKCQSDKDCCMSGDDNDAMAPKAKLLGSAAEKKLSDAKKCKR